MGKVIYKRRITKAEDIRQLKAGPISILTGKNLKTSSDGSSAKQKNPHPDGVDPPTETDGIITMMQKNGIELTRENYLELAYFGEPPDELSAEEEADLPVQFRILDVGR